MSLPFGGQTVIFVSFTEGVKDKWGIATPVPVDVPVSNCRFRPLSATETVELTDKAVIMWKLTSPPDAAAMGSKHNGQVKYTGPETGGVEWIFEIDGGPRTFPDANGTPYKTTVMCRLQQKQIA